jgi:hypothetical protein
MTDEVKPNPSEASTHDAQLVAESIVNGEAKAPEVDFNADYAAAQQLSQGVKVETPTKPENKTSQPEATKIAAQPTGNPDDYLQLAKEIGASKNEGVTEITDDLLQQALEKGQPKK